MTAFELFIVGIVFYAAVDSARGIKEDGSIPARVPAKVKKYWLRVKL